MESGVFCGSYGGKVSGDRRGECTYNFTYPKSVSELLSDSRPTYHRRTYLAELSQGLKIVKCSENSWIAVQGKEYTCVVTRDIAEVKSEKPDVYTIFSDSENPPNAQVSVILGTNEVCVGNGIADSFAEYHEELAINYLRQRLKEPILTYEETLQTAITAYRRLLPGRINPDEIKICVGRNNKSCIRENKSGICKILRKKYDPSPIIMKDDEEESIMILPTTEVAALFDVSKVQGSHFSKWVSRRALRGPRRLGLPVYLNIIHYQDLDK